VLLALALRADRTSGEAVLALLDVPPMSGGGSGARVVARDAEPGQAALAFVRAEALRSAGRHDEARIAYASAVRIALARAEPGPDRSSP
jgi:hypothetical protein